MSQGAPKGNQFWKLRSRHGRKKLFATPELFWEASCEYFAWIDAHPWTRNEVIKGGDLAGQIVKIEIDRPYTLTGLCLYLDCSTEWLRHFEDNNKESKDFMPMITRVREIIYTQKFEGAAVGAFSATIISKDLGLVDRQDVTQTTKQNVIIESATPEEEKLNEETLKDLDENQ